jgi:hypothetical protein
MDIFYLKEADTKSFRNVVKLITCVTGYQANMSKTSDGQFFEEQEMIQLFYMDICGQDLSRRRAGSLYGLPYHHQVPDNNTLCSPWLKPTL